MLGDAGVAGGALPGAGVTAPGAGATVVGFAGVTAVPPGDSDWPAAVVPPCGTDGPVGTLGAPGSDDVGDSAIGEGVVNEGTPRDGAPEVTLSAGELAFAAAPEPVPSVGAEVAGDVPVGAGATALPDVGFGAGFTVPGEEPIPLPVTVPAVEPGGGIGAAGVAGVIADGDVVPSCATTTGA